MSCPEPDPDAIHPMHKTLLIMDYDPMTRRVKPRGKGTAMNTGDDLADAIAVHIDGIDEYAKVSARLRTNKSKYSQTSVTKIVPLHYDPDWDIWIEVLPAEIMESLRWTSVDVQICIGDRVRELSFNKVRMSLTQAIVL